jgi:ParB/RepB/Spo0J family partition protein
MPQQKMMKTQEIIVPNEQVRKVYDPKPLEELTSSVKAFGILQPLLVMSTGQLLAGHRRLLAAKAAGLETVPVIVTDRLLSDSEIRLIQLTENMHRADLSGYEKWLACTEIMCMNPTWQMRELAQNLTLDASMITRLLSPSKCIVAAQDALRDGKVGISDCYAISKLPESEQSGLLALKLSGASRDTIEQAGRKKRAVTTSGGVKLSRIRAVLPSGVSIVASGEALSLDDLIESLGEAQKEAKKARDQGLDAKTFSAVMRDKAKKG